MNKVMLIGNISREIDLTELNSGKKVGRFTIAVNRKYENNGEKVADFITVCAWEKLADNVAKYCKKGSKVAVIGELQTRSYEVNNEKRYTFEVIAQEIQFLSTPKEEEKKDLKQVADDDCPF
jgi:single-strand DNA-binding protein